MKKLSCLLGLHDFSKWICKPANSNSNFEKSLERTCKHCGKTQTYEGLVQRDIYTRIFTIYL